MLTRVSLGFVLGLFGVLAFARACAAEDLAPQERLQIQAAEEARIRTIEKVMGAVVAIYGNQRQGGGAGVVFSPDGLALTNFHVVAACGEEGWAGLADGQFYRWKLIGLDPGGDLAVIRLAGKDRFTAAPIGDSSRLRVGDWAMAMGNPFVLAEDQKPTVTMGIVSAVARYQPGSGKNSLVYGNCIQVDASINPGNSGGPLFNMAGEVVGIIGRASFEERGRVNVGVGYAISADQAKNFLPELLAAKVALHGTLDATFGDRTGGVICERINLDSRAARLGLQLGDKLLAFDGQKIATSNQFLNRVCTLPAGWPVEVVFEHEGVKHSIWLRLAALPYGQLTAAPPGQPDKKKPRLPIRIPKKDTPPNSEQPPEAKPPDDKKPEGQPADKAKEPNEKQPDEAKPGDKPADGKPPVPLPQPIIQMQMPQLQIEPGKIRNTELNRQQCRKILDAWSRHIAADPSRLASVKAFRTVEEFSLSADLPLHRQVVWANDGRFRVDVEAHAQDAGDAFGWDGEQFWRHAGDGKVLVMPRGEAEGDLRYNVSILALAALYRDQPFGAFKQLELEGADKAAGRRAYRIRGELKCGLVVYLWFDAALDAEGNHQPALLKVAAQVDDAEDEDAWTFSDEQSVAGVNLVHRRSRVQGLSEHSWLPDVRTTSVEILDTVPDDLLRRPADAATE